MTATRAPSAAPAWACQTWADPVNIYVEIPGHAGGPSVVLSFAKSDQGLSKALKIMDGRYQAELPRSGTYKVSNPVPSNKVGINNFSTASREKTRDILRKMGLI